MVNPFSRHAVLLRVTLYAYIITDSLQSKWQKVLLKDLFVEKEYDLLVRPVLNDSHPVNVSFGLTLQQIIDVDERNQVIKVNVWLDLDEKNQMMHSNVWLDMTWKDHNLKWDPKDYDGIDEIRLPSSKVWTPDILLYNSADDRFDGTFHSNVIIYSTGDVAWIPPGMFKSTCKIEILWFPFDSQSCPLKFGSWTYQQRFLNLNYKDPKGGDVKDFIRNGEWTLIGVPVQKNFKSYKCCPKDIYPDVTFYVNIRRRTLYYGFNIILPCVLISSMSLLTFIMPPDSGEKISLGVTIVLSLMVFLLLVAETMPPTSDALPLIGIYFTCIMIMCSLSVVFTVFVLNCHHRGPEKRPMPVWMYNLICEWMAWVTMSTRPGHMEKRRLTLDRVRMRDMELKDTTSRSLLANILDLEDEPRLCYQHQNGRSVGLGTLEDAGYGDGTYSGSHRSELLIIIKELRKITTKMRKKEDSHDQKNDWKFAATVIDRCCLVLFSIFTVVATVAIMFTAPHIIDF